MAKNEPPGGIVRAPAPIPSTAPESAPGAASSPADGTSQAEPPKQPTPRTESAPEPAKPEDARPAADGQTPREPSPAEVVPQPLPLGPSAGTGLRPARSEAPVLASPPRFVVAEGKSLFTLRGLLGAFQQVKPRDFAGGEKELAEHLRAGFIVARH